METSVRMNAGEPSGSALGYKSIPSNPRATSAYGRRLFLMKRCSKASGPPIDDIRHRRELVSRKRNRVDPHSIDSFEILSIDFRPFCGLVSGASVINSHASSLLCDSDFFVRQFCGTCADGVIAAALAVWRFYGSRLPARPQQSVESSFPKPRHHVSRQ